jgi:citrate synthase
MEKWKTKISMRGKVGLNIRGYELLKLIREKSFIEVIFLLWRGTFPAINEEKMFNTMLVASSEHGLEAPSTFIARTVASCGTSLSTAIGAGILAIGERHGGAVEKIAFHMQSGISAKTIVQETLKNKEHLAGFGHKIYKTGDPRVEELFLQAKKYKLYGKFVKKALELERELGRQSKKSIPLNIDGALGALCLELGFDWNMGKAFFILARVAGIAAHVHEEITDSKTYHRLSEEDIDYIGPELK